MQLYIQHKLLSNSIVKNIIWILVAPHLRFLFFFLIIRSREAGKSSNWGTQIRVYIFFLSSYKMNCMMPFCNVSQLTHLHFYLAFLRMSSASSVYLWIVFFNFIWRAQKIYIYFSQPAVHSCFNISQIIGLCLLGNLLFQSLVLTRGQEMKALTVGSFLS